MPKLNKEQLNINLEDKNQLKVIKPIRNKLESEHLKIELLKKIYINWNELIIYKETI